MEILLNSSYEFLIPFDVPMIRVGNENDGGYVIPQHALSASSLISAGLGNNWTFEQEWSLLNKNKIYAYDGTIDTDQFDTDTKRVYDLIFKDQVIHFKENITVENIDSILKDSGPNTFLKMDIESDEYKVIPNICKATNLIGMVIEFHRLGTQCFLDQFKESIKLLSNNYNIVHLHGNNCSLFNDDFLPHTIEISFLKKEYCNTKEKRYDVYLEDLDFPNTPLLDEYKIRFTKES
jgi:hypothetical protein